MRKRSDLLWLLLVLALIGLLGRFAPRETPPALTIGGVGVGMKKPEIERVLGQAVRVDETEEGTRHVFALGGTQGAQRTDANSVGVWFDGDVSRMVQGPVLEKDGKHLLSRGQARQRTEALLGEPPSRSVHAAPVPFEDMTYPRFGLTVSNDGTRHNEAVFAFTLTAAR